MDRELRMLVVDDTTLLKLAMESLLRQVERELKIDICLDFTGSYEGATGLIRAGHTWDIAFVDLDLGVGRPGGLAVLDLLAEAPAPPRMVLFTEPDDPGRMLTLIAATTWFPVHAVMNKVGSFVADGTAIEDFGDLLHGVLAGSAPRRWVPPHCDASEVALAFKTLLPTGVWYRKFQAMRSEPSSATAAEMLGVTENGVRKDAAGVVDHIPGFWRAIEQALTRAGRHESDLFRAQLAAYTRDRESGKAAYSICHSFARGQELFFMEPYVSRRAELPPRGFHHRGSLASFKP